MKEEHLPPMNTATCIPALYSTPNVVIQIPAQQQLEQQITHQ